jgi:hypothetical protein
MSLTFKDLIGHLPTHQNYNVGPNTCQSIQRDTFKVICDRYTNDIQDGLIEDLKEDTKFRKKCVRDLEDEIKEKLKKDPDIIQKIRIETREVIQKEEYKKITQEVTEKLSKDLAPKLRKEVRHDFMRELSVQHPNIQERANFVELMHDNEVECTALHDVIMKDADNVKTSQQWQWVLNGIVITSVVVTILGLIIGSGWYFQNIMTAETWMIYFFVSMFLLIFSTICVWTALPESSKLGAKAYKLREYSSDYLTLAGEIKRQRMMTAAGAETKKQLNEAVEAIYKQKNNIDSKVYPDANTLNQARARVKTDLLNDYDPVKTLRVEDIKDFDTRLAEAEATHEKDIKKSVVE